METKDRIKLIMEDQHMTQQVFADFLQQSPATLSSIFNGRTRPTLNIVDSIKMKIPDISIEWLLYGTGEMYVSHPIASSDDFSEQPGDGQNLMLNFDTSNSVSPNGHQNLPSGVNFQQGVKNTHLEKSFDELKIVEKEPRRVTEIRVYYDDQTYETFVPAKK
ncbi:MAG: helix-turn-helix transcriptional regulator [Prevotella sp.]|jgi:transcriptional regulator with XRE-family HTH domain|nr:helix-turn-helix transcriptional regulator [Prevotella sp.]